MQIHEIFCSFFQMESAARASVLGSPTAGTGRKRNYCNKILFLLLHTRARQYTSNENKSNWNKFHFTPPLSLSLSFPLLAIFFSFSFLYFYLPIFLYATHISFFFIKTWFFIYFLSFFLCVGVTFHLISTWWYVCITFLPYHVCHISWISPSWDFS